MAELMKIAKDFGLTTKQDGTLIEVSGKHNVVAKLAKWLIDHDYVMDIHMPNFNLLWVFDDGSESKGFAAMCTDDTTEMMAAWTHAAAKALFN